MSETAAITYRAFLSYSHTIIARLVAEHPDWPQWKQDLAWFNKQTAALGIP